jgi:predicted HTH transcriptional regulator
MSEPIALDESQLRSIDGLPIRNTSLDDLDLDRVATHIQQARTTGRYSGPQEPITYLQRYQCVALLGQALHATPAGILCFGRHPQDYFPHAVVDLGHYQGLEPVSYDVLHLEKGIGGTLFDQIDRVENYLWANIHHGMTVGAGARRVELHEYPRVVLRELVVNLIAHRDYTNLRSTARVQKLRDRIEWVSPGGLPPGVTIENLLTAQASRNPAIVSVLYQAGLVEAFGQGLDTVVAVLKREELQPPRFEDLGIFFQVTVWGRPLALFSDLELAARLTDRQRRILTFIRAQRRAAPRDLADLFDQQVTWRSIQRDLKELSDAGLIEQEGKGRAIRYVPLD